MSDYNYDEQRKKPDKFFQVEEGKAAGDVVPADVIAEFWRRVDVQIPGDHVTLCDGCGKPLMEKEGDQAKFFAGVVLWIDRDGVSVNGQCGDCMAVTDLAT